MERRRSKEKWRERVKRTRWKDKRREKVNEEESIIGLYRHRGREMSIKTDKHKYGEIDRQTHTHTHTYIQTDRQRDRQTDRHIDSR